MSAPSSPMRPSREEAKKQTRQRLLDAALDLLVEEGFENLTTGRVAKRAGLAQPTFYVHFHDMDELLDELGTSVVRRLHEALRGLRDPLQSRGGDLAAICRRTFTVSLEALSQKSGLVRLFMAEWLHPQSSIGARVRQAMDGFAEDLVDEMLALPGLRDIPRQQMRLFADSLIAMAVNAGLGVAEGRYVLDADLVESLTDAKLALVGVLATRGGPGRGAPQVSSPTP